MTQQDTDKSVSDHIGRLVKEEHRLYEQKALSEADKERLKQVKVELDQCWDLLRQRRALREFGDDPGQARVRPPGVVESYEQ